MPKNGSRLFRIPPALHRRYIRPGLPNKTKGFLKILIRQYQLAATAQYTLAYKSGRGLIFRLYGFDCIFDISGIASARIRARAFVRPAITVRHHHLMDPRRRPFPPGAVVLVRADIDQRLGIAVIGAIHCNYVVPPRIGSSHAKCQFIGLTA